MKLSLRNKIMLPTLLLLAAGLAVAGAVSYHQTSAALEKAYYGQIRQVADSTAQAVAGWLDQRRQEIKLLAKNNLYATATMKSAGMAQKVVNKEMKAYVEAKPVYELIVLAAADGSTTSSSDTSVVGKVSVEDRGYFQEAMQGRNAVSGVIKSRSSGRPVVAVASPVMRGDTVKGVLIGVLDLAAFSERQVDPVKVGDAGYVYLFNREGMVIAHPDKDKILNLDLSRHEFGREMLAQGRGMLSYSLDGVAKTAVFRPAGDTGWYAAATVNHQDLFGPVRELGYANGLVALAVLAAAAVALFFLARSVSRPVGRIIRELNQGSAQVDAAADQVSSSSQSLAEGTSQQAASLEETAGAMEEMTSQTKSNAANAGEVKRVMGEEVGANFQELSSHTQKMQSTMAETVAAGEETTKIVKSIDEIAFQTNLLALNAAVEAARAGEAGAGFAVVADEVRNLAMRAAEAAKNTQELIERSGSKTKEAADLLERMAQALEKNQELGGKVAGLVEEIAAASGEQAEGIEQVNRAVSEMDTVTQKSASTAEESAAAAEELDAQAITMRGSVTNLLALVNGGSGGNGGREGAARRAPRKLLAHEPKHQEQSGGKGAKAKAAKPADPQKEIPLEDGDFADF
jgi:methyl-accepting chemotaxis protein